MAKRLNTAEFVKKAIEIHGSVYDYSGSTYKNYKTSVDIVCRSHGAFSQKPNNHLFGAGCPKCRLEIVSAKNRGSLEEFVKKSTEVHGGKYDYSQVLYETTNAPVKIICKEHGVFEQKPHSHVTGRGCSRCSTKHGGFNTAEFIKRASEVHGEKYNYSTSLYVGYKKQLKIVCKEHGAFFQEPNNHLQGKGCPVCIGRVSFDTESFIKSALLIHKDRFDYSHARYVRAKSKIDIICQKHGKFQQTPGNHLNGNGCPKCDTKVSKGEQELYEFILGAFPDAEQSNRDIISPKELDIVIPSIKVAIEYNGLRYHSDRFEGRIDTYHLNKTNSCRGSGYRLIHIWEDDWRDKKSVVKNMLLHILGKNKERVFARKCSVAKVNGVDVRGFFSDNHIQGWARGSSCYTLELNNVIIAAMIFSHQVSNRGSLSGENFELVRYATSKSVIGGASRLLSAFLKDNPSCASISSYSSNEIYTGGMYVALGFEAAGITRPDYKVVDGGRRRHKSRYRRASLEKMLGDEFDPSLTERENCRNNDLYRVYDCGLTKWELTV